MTIDLVLYTNLTSESHSATHFDSLWFDSLWFDSLWFDSL